MSAFTDIQNVFQDLDTTESKRRISKILLNLGSRFLLLLSH